MSDGRRPSKCGEFPLVFLFLWSPKTEKLHIKNTGPEKKSEGKLTTGPKIIDFPKRFSFILFT